MEFRKFISAVTRDHHLSQINPFHALSSYFFKIHFNIVLSSLLRSSKWCLSFIFPYQYFVSIYLLPHTVPCLSEFILRYLFTRIIFGEDHNFRSCPLCSFFRFPVTHLSWCVNAFARKNKRGELKLCVERAARGALLWSAVRVVDVVWEPAYRILHTDIRHLTAGILPEQCVVRRFRRWAVIQGVPGGMCQTSGECSLC